MEFQPKYTITNKILANVARIATVVAKLNSTSYTKIVLAEFEQRASSLSAFASTSIEGNPLPLADVKRLLRQAPPHIRDSETEVLNYNSALQWLNKLIAKDSVIDVQILLQTQKHVTQGLLSEARSGRWRSEAVFVNNPQTAQPVYLPPDHLDVPPLMTQLLHYVKANLHLTDPLIVAGIFHKQFVIIHPFMDGNGRTARLVTKLLLARMGLNTFNLFSFENYYNRNVGAYFESVGVTGNYYDISGSVDFTIWLEYFTDGILDELQRIGKELSMIDSTPETVMRAHQTKILKFVKEHGFIADRDYATLTDRARPTRHKDFKKLMELGLLKQLGKGKNTYYKLIDA